MPCPFWARVALFIALLPFVQAFIGSTQSSCPTALSATTTWTPLLDFARNDTVAKFDRIDDVIMVSKCPW